MRYGGVGRLWVWGDKLRDKMSPWAPKSLEIYRNIEKEIGQGDHSQLLGYTLGYKSIT